MYASISSARGRNGHLLQEPALASDAGCDMLVIAAFITSIRLLSSGRLFCMSTQATALCWISANMKSSSHHIRQRRQVISGFGHMQCLNQSYRESENATVKYTLYDTKRVYIPVYIEPLVRSAAFLKSLTNTQYGRYIQKKKQGYTKAGSGVAAAVSRKARARQQFRNVHLHGEKG